MRQPPVRYAALLQAWADGLIPTPGPELQALAQLLARTASPQGQAITSAAYAARHIPRSPAKRLELLRLALDVLRGTPFLPAAQQHGRTLLAMSAMSRVDADATGRTYQRWLAFEALLTWEEVPHAWWESLLMSTAIGHHREWQRLALLGQRVAVTASLDAWVAQQPPAVAGLVLGASWPQWDPAARDGLGHRLLPQLTPPPGASHTPSGSPENADADPASIQTAQTLLRGLLHPAERVTLITELAQGGGGTAPEGTEGQMRWILERWQTAGPPLDRRAWAPLLQSGDRWIREQALKAIGGGAPAVVPSYPERATPRHPRPLR